MALHAGPLTTIFTPPSSCLNVVTSAASPFSPSYSVFIGHFGPYQTLAASCYPSSTTPIDFFTDNYYWSPGYCPQGYTTACTYTPASLGPSVTASLCCPIGFDCAYPELPWPHVCNSVPMTALTNVWILTGTTGTLPISYSFSTLEPNPTLVVWNDGVPVAWEKTDAEILALISATQTTSSITSASTASITSPRTSASSRGSLAATPTGTSPLQTFTNIAPAAAATNPPAFFSGHHGTVRIILIVVVPIGFFALLFIVFCYFRHYKLSISRRTGSLESPHKGQLRGKDAKFPLAVEADSSTRHEMASGVSIRPELASTVVYELGSDTKGSASVGMEEKTQNISPSVSPNPHALESGDHNFGATSPSSVLISPRSPTIPRKPIARLSAQD